MQRIELFLKHLYETKISRNFDRIVPVIGDEGVGKSTFILEAIGRYQQIRGGDPSAERVLDAVVLDSREAFEQRLLDASEGDPIAAMDAAHILYKKEAMDPDQIETEKRLLDIRLSNFLIFLGYQDWRDIPDQLQRRRAKNAFYIPKRGVVYGYNRETLDEKYDGARDSGWPDPDLRDTFPSLDGTEVWERFQELDAARKEQRLRAGHEGDDEEAELTPQDVAHEIRQNDPAEYVEFNDYNGQAYVSKPLIKFDYPALSDQQADQVKHAIRRETDAVERAERQGGEGDPPPPQSNAT